jgi:hypothetical protein
MIKQTGWKRTAQQKARAGALCLGWTTMEARTGLPSSAASVHFTPRPLCLCPYVRQGGLPPPPLQPLQSLFFFRFFLERCHYNSSTFEKHHWKSPILRNTIIIPSFAEPCHFVQPNCMRAHCQHRIYTGRKRWWKYRSSPLVSAASVFFFLPYYKKNARPIVQETSS